MADNDERNETMPFFGAGDVRERVYEVDGRRWWNIKNRTERKISYKYAARKFELTGVWSEAMAAIHGWEGQSVSTTCEERKNVSSTKMEQWKSNTILLGD